MNIQYLFCKKDTYVLISKENDMKVQTAGRERVHTVVIRNDEIFFHSSGRDTVSVNGQVLKISLYAN